MLLTLNWKSSFYLLRGLGKERSETMNCFQFLLPRSTVNFEKYTHSHILGKPLWTIKYVSNIYAGHINRIEFYCFKNMLADPKKVTC